MQKNTRIVVLGAGVGGLSAVHELIRTLPVIEGHQYHINVVERNSEAGGQARSAFKPTAEGPLHTEYCWHAFGTAYNNLLELMADIPIADESGRNVRCSDNLEPINSYAIVRNNGKILREMDNTFISSGSIWKFIRACFYMRKSITWRDTWRLIDMYLLANTSCLARLEEYDHIYWYDFCEGLSPECFRWLAESPSIFLGMDIDNLNAHTMLYMLRPSYQKYADRNKHIFWALAGPMNMKLFAPWVLYLTGGRPDINVNFDFNTDVENICIADTVIYGIKTVQLGVEQSTMKGKVYLDDLNPDRFLFADYVVNALSVEGWLDVLMHVQSRTPRPLVKDTADLIDRSMQIQTQVLYYVDARILTDDKTFILTFPDSPWFLMARQESTIWYKSGIKTVDTRTWETDIVPEYKDLLAVGIGIVSEPGLNGKTFLECTRSEVIEEVWMQMMQPRTALSDIKIEDCGNITGRCFTDLNYLRADIWDSFANNGQGMTTYEPKFSNGVGTLEMRPPIISPYFSNVVNGAGWAKTETNIFNMESACEAGRKAGRSVAKMISGKKIDTAWSIVRDQPWGIYRLAQSFDEMLYKWRKPHISVICRGSPLLIVIVIGIALLVQLL
jgi:hypothetical protein